MSYRVSLKVSPHRRGAPLPSPSRSHVSGQSRFRRCHVHALRYLHNPAKQLWRVGLNVLFFFSSWSIRAKSGSSRKTIRDKGGYRMRECRETLGISHYGRFGRCDDSALIKKASHRTRYKLNLVLCYIIFISHFVVVRDDPSAAFHLNTRKLAFKVQISKIWIFHIVTGSLIHNFK